jgi:hypothetical protein|tara:strand:- start:351 stop:536 length:186 start_codon:yes stop_codon:yes gene_type:complete
MFMKSNNVRNTMRKRSFCICDCDCIGVCIGDGDGDGGGYRFATLFANGKCMANAWHNALMG